MEKRARSIVRDSSGEIEGWYDFCVSDDAKEEDCHIEFKPTGEVELYIKDERIADISYMHMTVANMPIGSEPGKVVYTENQIADYIYLECRKYEKHRKIYADRSDVEYGIASVIAGDADDFQTKTERELEEYFREREERYPEEQFY